MRKTLQYLFSLLVLAGCSSVAIYQMDLDELYGQELIPDRRVSPDSTAGQHFNEHVNPIIENRCVVCHGCYDAPCQLKLSSADGILRGASKELVYDGTRILAADPTRLKVDALTTEQWREKDFFAVLNERSQVNHINASNSLMYRMLQLKQQHPLPKEKLLDDDFQLGLSREQQCATIPEFDEFALENPLWGMPYALPKLSQKEHSILSNWIVSGAPLPHPKPLAEKLEKQVNDWEAFLNEDSLKHQLTGRYIYEHLFLANLYFTDTALFSGIKETKRPGRFFKLVRSSTPPGFPIRIIPTRRPYDDPKTRRVYYRLQLLNATVVAKSHMPYALNQERLDWVKELFIIPDYAVEELPSYSLDVATNPMVTFKDLPVSARYRFILKESEFIISGFIKGPVCRGQVALNVIDDHFWVFFVDPQHQSSEQFSQFLSEQSNNLRLPGEASSNTGIIRNWLRYSSLHDNYLEARNQGVKQGVKDGLNLDMSLIWNGEHKNQNSALTVFRHFDSSTVMKGLVGQNPKTAWLIGYPLLERIHYLLVAEFDVYGNIGHQLITRLYMDFLRMEGEFNFLALLPQKERIKLANHWYRDTSDSVKEHLIGKEGQYLDDPKIKYLTNNPKVELFEKIRSHLKGAVSSEYDLFNLTLPPEQTHALSAINKVAGTAANIMPEVSTLMVVDTLQRKQLYTIIRNSGHSNISSLLSEDENRLPEEDYLSVVPGVVGTYPNAFYKISESELSVFTSSISKLEDEDDYEILADRFSIRRTNRNFWQHSDQVHRWFKAKQPLTYGVLDYNRLENR